MCLARVGQEFPLKKINFHNKLLLQVGLNINFDRYINNKILSTQIPSIDKTNFTKNNGMKKAKKRRKK